MGTLLQTLGLPVGTAPEGWNLEWPEAITAVHRAYAEAGAEWTVTNTFGGNHHRLAHSGLASRVREVNAAAVRCARLGASGLPLLGSLGPTTAPDPNNWVLAYQEQVEALAEAGVSGFLVETIMCLPEALVAVRTARTAQAGPVIASFTPRQDGHLLDGTTLEEAAESLVQAGASVLGVNCGTGPESLLAPIQRLVKIGIAPIYAAPNAGLPQERLGRYIYQLKPDGFAEAAIQFQDAGVRLIAGCCGIHPEHIRAARARLRSTPIGENK